MNEINNDNVNDTDESTNKTYMNIKNFIKVFDTGYVLSSTSSTYVDRNFLGIPIIINDNPPKDIMEELYLRSDRGIGIVIDILANATITIKTDKDDIDQFDKCIRPILEKLDKEFNKELSNKLYKIQEENKQLCSISFMVGGFVKFYNALIKNKKYYTTDGGAFQRIINGTLMKAQFSDNYFIKLTYKTTNPVYTNKEYSHDIYLYKIF